MSSPPPSCLPAAASPQPVAALSNPPSLTTGWRDKPFAALFVAHLGIIVGLAFLWGLPAVKSDASKREDDPTRPALDLNASLFLRVILLACAVGGGMSVLMLYVLAKAAGGLIKCALYTSLVVQAAMAAAMFAVSPLFGGLMLIPLLLTAWYIYAVRRRIDFAAAHVEVAVAAVKAHGGVFAFALAMIILQVAWVSLWSLAAFGVEHRINNLGSNSTSASLSANDDDAYAGGASSSATAGTSASTLGGATVFLMLISLLWGTQLLKYIVEFVTSAVTGHFWFLSTPTSPVKGSIWRAFTHSFGSLALGSLIVAVLEALKRAAKAAQNRSSRRGDNALAFIACCAVCILGCVESLVEYLNKWAVVNIALTGSSFARGGRDAWDLFKSRGWTAVINDDLTGDALRIAAFMVAAAGAVVGAGVTYVAMPTSPIRKDTAAVAAALCFVVSYGMATVMVGVLGSAVRTVFVCFAMNPGALSQTHPGHLQRLVAAWNAFHPATFADCGYAASYGGVPGGGGLSPAV
jgi:hypothetical protein